MGDVELFEEVFSRENAPWIFAIVLLYLCGWIVTIPAFMLMFFIFPLFLLLLFCILVLHVSDAKYKAAVFVFILSFIFSGLILDRIITGLYSYTIFYFLYYPIQSIAYPFFGMSLTLGLAAFGVVLPILATLTAGVVALESARRINSAQAKTCQVMIILLWGLIPNVFVLLDPTLNYVFPYPFGSLVALVLHFKRGRETLY